jgi:integrase
VAAGAIAGPFQAIDRALYLTAAMTGLRQGELVALRWRDVDWTAARIRVRQNHVLGEFGTPKSRRSTRSVPMADPVAAELERLYQRSSWQDDDDLVFADPTVTNPPVNGAPLGKAAILKRFRKALKAARLDSSHVFSRPAARVRDADGGARRANPNDPRVDGPQGHPDDPALRRLRAEHARSGVGRCRVRPR